MQKRIILDTDPGIDDILALLLALASPEIRIEAITTVSGNVGVEQTSYNALAFLESCGCATIPVARGSARPLERTPIDAQYYHGKNGIGEVVLPAPQGRMLQKSAVDLIIETVAAHPGQITLVAIGPLTNLAHALLREPAIAHQVEEVIIMGGALRTPGNVTPVGEFNIVADPHAAQIVFHAGWPIRLISLDVTHQVRLRTEHIAQLRRIDNSVARSISDMIKYNTETYPDPFYPGTFIMHDPLSLSVVMRPELIQWEEVYVAVELQGKHTLGETVAYFPEYATRAPKAPNLKASVGVDAEAFLAWYTERVCEYLRGMSSGRVDK